MLLNTLKLFSEFTAFNYFFTTFRKKFTKSHNFICTNFIITNSIKFIAKPWTCFQILLRTLEPFSFQLVYSLQRSTSSDTRSLSFCAYPAVFTRSSFCHNSIHSTLPILSKSSLLPLSSWVPQWNFLINSCLWHSPYMFENVRTLPAVFIDILHYRFL